MMFSKFVVQNVSKYAGYFNSKTCREELSKFDNGLASSYAKDPHFESQLPNINLSYCFAQNESKSIEATNQRHKQFGCYVMLK